VRYDVKRGYDIRPFRGKNTRAQSGFGNKQWIMVTMNDCLVFVCMMALVEMKGYLLEAL